MPSQPCNYQKIKIKKKENESNRVELRQLNECNGEGIIKIYIFNIEFAGFSEIE